MDYSILMVRLKSLKPLSNAYKDKNYQNVYWRFGIIDFLQLYTVKKQLEREMKLIGTQESVSSIDVISYSERLVDTVNAIFV